MKSEEQLRRVESGGNCDGGSEYQLNKVEFYCHRKLFIEWQDVDCFMLSSIVRQSSRVLII